MRLLMVEDDELLGSAVQKGLMRSGYAVDWIRTGGDLSVAMRTHLYECVLLDLGLPDIGGEVLAQEHPAARSRHFRHRDDGARWHP